MQKINIKIKRMGTVVYSHSNDDQKRQMLEKLDFGLKKVDNI